MKHLIALFSAMVIYLGTMGSSPIALAQGAPTCAYFTETGHNIHGAFLAFYVAFRGRVNFGLPLTEAFMENDHLVQYFQYARLELHPENPDPYRVQLGLLGEQYGVTDPRLRAQAIPSAGDSNFRYFPDTGQTVSFMFKRYFESHGDVDVFGYPISGVRYEAGEFVQYFQRQRLVWNLLDTSGNAVRPSPIGDIALTQKYGADFKWRARMPQDWCSDFKGMSDDPGAFPTPARSSLPLSRMALIVRAQFQQSAPSGPQYVTVTVEDQNGARVPNVALYAVVRLPTGERYFPLLVTDIKGKSGFSFEIGNQPNNSVVPVEIFASYESLRAVGKDVFTIYR